MGYDPRDCTDRFSADRDVIVRILPDCRLIACDTVFKAAVHRRGVNAAMSRSQKEGFQPTLSILVGLYDPLGHKTRQDHGPHGQQTTYATCMQTCGASQAWSSYGRRAQ